MITLGIDASYTRTGMVWVDDTGLLDYAAFGVPMGPNRLQRAAQAMRYKLTMGPKVNRVFMERAAGLAGPKLSMLQGAFAVVLQGMGYDFDPEKHLVSPQTWKKWLTGYGRADKAQVREFLDKRFNIAFQKDPGNDLADAAGIALWGRSK